MTTALQTRIASSPRARFGSGVEADVVEDAERVLGVRFPQSYRWWLLRYGAGYLSGYELQGLAPVKPSERDPAELFVGDVVNTAVSNRRLGLASHLIELLSYEGDEEYFLDLSRMVADEAPVVRRVAGSEAQEDFAPSFAAFLEQHL